MNYKRDPTPINLQLQPVLPIIVAAILVLVALFSNMSFVTNMLRENLGLDYVLSWLSGVLPLHADDLDVPGENEENPIGQSSRSRFRLVRRHSKSQSMGNVTSRTRSVVTKRGLLQSLNTTNTTLGSSMFRGLTAS